MFNGLRLLGRQRWIRFGVRDRIIRKFCSHNTVESKKFEIDFFGLRYGGNLNSYIDWSAYFFGAYEMENLLLFKDLVKDEVKPVFLDIGANVGHHTLFMSLHCSVVHSFEPNPSVRSKIDEKKSLNNINNIVVHGVGMGAVDEELPFYAPQGSNQGTGSFVEGYSENNEVYGTLKIVNADTYISDLHLDKIDLIKIDVEGFEKNVLKGLMKTFSSYRPKVIMEFSEATKSSFTDADELLSMFPDNYEIKNISYDQPRFIFFNSPNWVLKDFDFTKTEGDLLITPIC